MEALAGLRSSSRAGCSSSYGAARTPFRSGGETYVVALRRACPAAAGAGAGAGAGAVSVRAKGRRNPMPGRAAPAAPALPKFDDDDTPKFVIFIRTLNVPRWYPLSVVSGGTTAKLMLGAMRNPWGKKLYEGTLTRNMASVVYKDERTVRQTALKTYPVLKAASGFLYGYKVVDKENPKAVLSSSDVIEIPPQDQLLSVVDKVKQGFSNFTSGVKDTFSGMSPIVPEPEPESEPEAKPAAGKKSSRRKRK